MIFLLDTNAFLWALADMSKLGQHTASDLTNPGHSVYVPDTAILECAIKSQRNKLEYDIDFLGLDKFFATNNLQKSAFDAWSAVSYTELPDLTWADPFDMAVMAQAVAKRMTLVTSDERILSAKIPGLRLLDARQ